MKKWILGTLLTCMAALCFLSASACCQENAAKTSECADMDSTESCEECCGGNYSYMGEGSCKCF